MKLEKNLEELNLGKGMRYNRDTDQYKVRITLYNNDNEHTKKVSKGLDTIIKYLKPVDTNFGKCIVIDIFENTLSEGGVYNLLIRDDGKYAVSLTTYGYPKLIKEWDDKDTILKYVQENHYYMI